MALVEMLCQRLFGRKVGGDNLTTCFLYGRSCTNILQMANQGFDGVQRPHPAVHLQGHPNHWLVHFFLWPLPTRLYLRLRLGLRLCLRYPGSLTLPCALHPLGEQLQHRVRWQGKAVGGGTSEFPSLCNPVVQSHFLHKRACWHEQRLV